MGNPRKGHDLVEWGSLELVGPTAEKPTADNILTIRVTGFSLLGIREAHHNINNEDSKTLLETRTFQLKKKYILKNLIIDLRRICAHKLRISFNEKETGNNKEL